MIRVLIVNETRLMCSVLGAVLHEEEDIFVVGYATAVAEAIEKSKDADVLLVDIGLPDDGAIQITQTVDRRKNGTHVVITGMEKAPEMILTYIEAGASGYVLQEVGLEELLQNVRAVHKEEAVASPEIVAKLIARVSELSEKCLDKEAVLQQLETLTPRETEVLEAVSEGLTNKEIGERLTIEPGTVKNHVHNILDKLNVSSRHKAAEIYEQQN